MLCTFLGKLKQSSNNYSTLILLCNIGKYFIFGFHLDHTGNTDVFITLFMSQYQKMKTCDLGRSRDSLLLAMGIYPYSQFTNNRIIIKILLSDETNYISSKSWSLRLRCLCCKKHIKFVIAKISSFCLC